MNQNMNQSRMSNANGMHHSNNHMYNQPIKQPINQSNMQIHQPVNQSGKQPINQPVNQPINQKKSILLFSNFSNECKKLRSSLHPEQMNLFRPICIDNQKIRNLIESSDNVQVTVVPCILEIMTNGTVAKYEGFESCIKWINVNSGQHNTQYPQNHSQERVQGLPQTPIENVIQSKQQSSQYAQSYQQPYYQEKYIDQDYSRNKNSRDYHQDTYREPYNETTQKLTGTQGKRPTEIKIPEKYADVNRKGPSRTAYRGEINEPGTIPSGLYSNRDMELPDRGIGHTGMRSSLHDIEGDDRNINQLIQQPIDEMRGSMGDRYNQHDQSKQHGSVPPIPVNKQAPYPVSNHGHNRQGTKSLKMIEDLTPTDDEINLDEDPSGMGKGNMGGDPRTVNNQSKAMQEKSNAIKRLADQISQSRDETENEMTNAKQRSIRQTRKIDMDTPVNI